MKLKLIKVKDHLLLIDEEAEIKEDELCLLKENHYINGGVGKYNNAKAIGYGLHNTKFFEKIIAYYPLTKEVKEFDLPLLPPFENNNEIGGGVFNEQLWENYRKPLNRSMSHLEREAFIEGYKAAQSNKQFSLEDIKKAFEAGANWQEGGTILYPDIHGFAQSLSAQQTYPKEFIPEWTQTPSAIFRENDVPYAILKTITNSEGKKELVGTWKY